MKAGRDGEAAKDRKTSLAGQDLRPRDHTPSESCRAGPFREGTRPITGNNSAWFKPGKRTDPLSSSDRAVAGSGTKRSPGNNTSLACASCLN